MSKPTKEQIELLEKWRETLNKRFVIKNSINDRWIFCLNDEEEDEYSFLDDWIAKSIQANTAVTEERVRGEEREKLNKIQKLVDEQANDLAIWFPSTNITEAYLQKELRKLHAVIEDDQILLFLNQDQNDHDPR